MSLSNQNKTAIRRNARWLLRLTVLFFSGIFAYQPAIANPEPKPVFELTYLTFGQYHFFIKIYGDGKVHYQGNKVMIRDELSQHVGVVGDQYEQLTPNQVEELSVAFLSLPYKELKKYEKKMPAVTWANVVKYTDAYAEIRINNAIFFLATTTKLNKFIDIKKWICFPENHPEHKNCLIHDLPDNFEY